ncbi:MAG: hypothetical protein R3B09_17770 [Nannocystaceae bacterium]
MRLPPIVPQHGDDPVHLQRALYKAGTGSIKSAGYLLSALNFAVVAALGASAWEDDAVGEWAAALAERWPSRPDDAALQALHDQAAARGDVPRSRQVRGARLDPAARRERFQLGAIDRFLGSDPDFDEADLLAAALAELGERWSGPALVDIAVTWAWPPSLDLDRQAVTVGILAVLVLVDTVPIAEAIERHVAALDPTATVEAWEAQALRANFRGLGAPEGLVDRIAAAHGRPLPP